MKTSKYNYLEVVMDRENKKYLIFLLTILSFLVVCSTAVAGELTLQIKSPPYKIVNETGGAAFFIKDFQQMEDPGSPKLPQKAYWVLLPPQTDLATVKIRIVHETKIPVPERLEIPPASLMVSLDTHPETRWGEGKKIENGRDLNIYMKNAFYPKSTLILDSTSQLQTWKLARVIFRPVQYNPVTREALWIKELGFALDFGESKESSVSSITRSNSTLFETLSGDVLNIADELLLYGGSAVTPKSLTGNGYVIITADAIKNALYTRGTPPDPPGLLYQFASHKESLGFNVYIVTETECIPHSGGATENGYGTAEGQQRAVNIRDWLINNHGESQKNIKYVLLVGDPDPDDPEIADDTYGDIPMMMCFPGQNPKVPTDYFFAELTGNWDLDGDGKYCEFSGDRGSGGVEFAAEVYVGRIPFSDTPKIGTILQKIINYENISYSTADNSNLVWRKRVLLPMSILNFGMSAWAPCSPSDGTRKTDEAYLGRSLEENIFFNNGFSTLFMTEKEGVYYSDVDGDAALPTTYNGLSDYWNTAKYYGIVFWSAHGSQSSIYRKYVETINDECPSTENLFYVSSSTPPLDDSHPAFLVSSSCNIGYPENPGNLGFELMEKGSVGMVVSSRRSWSYEGAFSSAPNFNPKPVTSSDIRSTCYYFTQELVGNIPAGQALFSVKQQKSLSQDMAWSNNFVANLYGDPSLHIYPFSIDGADSDGDGISDNEELYIYQSDPSSNDTDGDGVLDRDELYFMGGDWMIDPDGDNLNALNDADSDGDGLEDGTEVSILHTSPGMADTDKDGMSDYDEVNMDGNPGNYTEGADTNPNDPDTDDDGVLDGNDTNPLDPWDNRPTANAGPDQYIDAQPGGTTVNVDGSQSSDPNGDTLIYEWRVSNYSSLSEHPGYFYPNNSTDAASSQFVAKVGGDYVVQLEVKDDNVWSDPDTAIIHVQHRIESLSSDSATWGDTLSIYGAGFDDEPQDNKVTISGIDAEVTAADYGELQVLVPSGCKSGDVVVTVNEKQSNAVHIEIELPAGTFVQAPNGSFPEASHCSMAAAMGDIDGDGDIDIVVANMGGLPDEDMDYDDLSCQSMDPQNRVYINDGSGTFSDATFGPDGTPGTVDDRLPVDSDQSTDVKLVDIDGDHDLDIVVANSGPYNKEQDFGIGLEVRCSGHGGQNRIYINDGTGHFSDETAIRMPELDDHSVELAIGDINGDGFPDLVFGNDMECVEAQEYWPENPDCCYDCEYCQEVDCNDEPESPCCTGECDSCSCCSDCAECPDNPGCQPFNQLQPSKDRVLINNGSGYFHDETESRIGTDQYGRSLNGGLTTALALKDMDNDGDLDLVRYGAIGGNIGLFLYKNGNGQLGDIGDPRNDALVSGANVVSILVENFDSDSSSHLDVFAPAGENNYPVYLVQEGEGFVDHSHYSGDDWLPPTLSHRRGDFNYWISGISFDADMDGDKDIIVGRKGNASNLIFINDNDQPGHLSNPPGLLPALGVNTYDMAAGDVDGDNVPDLFYANVGQNILLLNSTRPGCSFDKDHDGDVDGLDLAHFVNDPANVTSENINQFACQFGKIDCGGI